MISFYQFIKFIFIVIFFNKISRARHHHHHHDSDFQKCGSAWSGTQFNFTFASLRSDQVNLTNTNFTSTPTNLNGPNSKSINSINSTQNPSISNQNINSKVNSSQVSNYQEISKELPSIGNTIPNQGPGRNLNENSTIHYVNITGIPWNYEGIPLNFTLTSISKNVTNLENQINKENQNLFGLPCMDSGVLYSCNKCEKILTGRDCYKKIGTIKLDSTSSGDIQCNKWFTRTAYGEGGGVTICASQSGDVYQCSSDKHVTECEGCNVIGFVSK
ncbi:hypothetical protein O181_129789 [Austropuccinia psidii MF-1]|uniref:Uncharacterized protein n=1 Tax=Austropuccinia psidii MF-1 TaxID=1389203 RepID=A0A9Q3Q9E7_9BASI|nr:hypothetical protein [Austropuccinia psidii MF-1]